MSNVECSLSPALKPRHVTMLSIAGVIGAGLFVGSGHAIAAAGPAVLLAYALAGTLVVLVMRMLGEMAVASPDTGSFSSYAQQGIGRWAGFTIGWLYWWFWVLVIPLEAVAAAAILSAWFPAIATWQFALIITGILTVTNLFSVAKYGEFEFWFALLKVIAIVAFIALGAAALVGALPGREVSGLSNLMAHTGGFMPNGFGAVLGALLTTMFSFMGTEIVTIAAAESKDPSRQISRATNSVIWRIALFYLVSIFLVVSMVPWNDAQLPLVGSYQRALEILSIPNAKLIVDCVVLVAVASCLNSALYTASRMLYSLARRGDAPAKLGRASSSGVPRAAVLASTAVGFLTTIANYTMPRGGVQLPAVHLRCRRPAGLPGHCRDPAAPETQADGPRRAAGIPHVAVPMADLGGDRLHRRRPDRDAVQRSPSLRDPGDRSAGTGGRGHRHLGRPSPACPRRAWLLPHVDRERLPTSPGVGSAPFWSTEAFSGWTAGAVTGRTALLFCWLKANCTAQIPAMFPLVTKFCTAMVQYVTE